ncbi:hypothetical protein [Sphingomonas colocasiae]|uniref:Uncharacterized protein n=1 Tax=Sphingomonas colocasiae TaxID=1848973 RepID=A0ABS7PXQ8_9SPHN|nr:hypothetical protein [Sphingomonas colocasiae]MBY8826132.1 hypothetical protein [Sphingomonas colocasiae]
MPPPPRSARSRNSMWAKLAAGAGILALAAFAIWMFGNARHDAGRLAEAAKWQAEVRVRDQRIADLRVENERRETASAVRYAERLAAIDPIILRSTERVIQYAQTPAGRAACLAADRVRGIEADAAALFPAYPAGADRRGDAVRPDTAAGAAGRIDDER